MYRAVTRQVSASLGDCELSFVDRARIDVDRARAQHAAYCDMLRRLGCEVIELPALDAHPDAVFVEDTALVFDEVAVITRPGAESRRGETASIAEALAPFRPLLRTEAPGTIDGGDVMRIGRQVFVGRSARSNDAAIAQLSTLLAPFGYTVQGVDTRECLHLKSAVTAVGEGRVLIQPAWVDAGVFSAWERIEIDPDEPHAANALRIGDAVVYPDSFPRTCERLRAQGVEVHTVALGELQKAEGATTCCSLVFAA